MFRKFPRTARKNLVPLPLVILTLISSLLFSGCTDLGLLDEVKSAVTGVVGENKSKSGAKSAENIEQTSEQNVPSTKEDFYKDKPFITLGADTGQSVPGKPRLTAYLPEETVNETVVITGSSEPGCIIFINGKKIIASSSGDFNAPIQLAPGKNIIEVTAKNKQGQSNSMQLETTFNPPVPRLAVNIPSRSDRELVNLSGTTDAGCRVEVDNKSVRVRHDGSFAAPVALVPGTNNIVITATNKFGKSTTVQKKVDFQPGSPRLVVAVPETSKEQKVVVSGFTEPGCIVYVNSAKVQVNSDGSFAYEIDLEQGANTIQVISINKYGKSSAAQKTVTYVVNTYFNW